MNYYSKQQQNLMPNSNLINRNYDQIQSNSNNLDRSFNQNQNNQHKLITSKITYYALIVILITGIMVSISTN